MKTAIFGAGCFWGVEAAFHEIDGVISTAVGYSGGHFENPTYKDVCTGETGHAEVVQLKFDDTKVSYEALLDTFWTIHDPTTLNHQGPDVGTQYRSVIFYHDTEQEALARESLARQEANGKFRRPIVTEIVAESAFFRAEDYHQQYFKKRGIAQCRI
jgi:peptide-methionine (S)-S-oxide reductase